jgi:hypothetical protein
MAPDLDTLPLRAAALVQLSLAWFDVRTEAGTLGRPLGVDYPALEEPGSQLPQGLSP